MEEKICESCGMPMRVVEDFGGGDPENRYCKHCTDSEGKLKDFDTALKDLVNFVTSRMGVEQAVAEKLARENMAKMLAWKQYFEGKGGTQ